MRRCIACMTCSQQRTKGWLVCLLNPETGHEGAIEPLAAIPRKVLVLDAGAAGLEAARVARLRGHQVALWCREAKPGARWAWLIRAYLHQQLKELKELGVEVELGKTFSAEAVAQARPEAVVAGPELKPIVPQFMGIHQDNVLLAEAVLDRGGAVGERVAVIGAGNIGCEVAYFLTNRGKKVTLLEPGPRFGQGLEERTARVAQDQLRQRGVGIHLSVELRRLEGTRLVFLSASGAEEAITVDSVVLALGYEADYRLVDELQERGLAVHRVGASTGPVAAYELAQRGAAIARKI